ncbi:MAG: ABC transporter permease [Bacteroidales bacterium]|nr:ABC transporter permease [Bacteroidales bacterium]MDE7072350.1 ABC transporter permease [Bacteroidales bacterium]
MKQFLAFVEKEFYHIFRDKATMLIILLMPIVQVLIFGFAITTDIRDTEVAVCDLSQSMESRELIEKIQAGEYFNVSERLLSPQEADNVFRKGKVKSLIVIPEDFSNRIALNENTAIQIITDGSNPNEANIITGYLQTITAQFAAEQHPAMQPPISFSAETRMLYNPLLKSAFTFVPGVIGLVLMLICTLMTSVSIVREREHGTMEALLVAPSKPLYLIFAKTVPYFVISLFNLAVIILLSIFAFDVPIRGSFMLFIGTSITYIFTSLCLGIFISTVSKTQQIAMIISLMGLMLPTVLLSGLMFPIESMPVVLQGISYLLPARWFIDMGRIIMIKGLGFHYIWIQWAVLTGMAGIFLALSVRGFKVRLD